ATPPVSVTQQNALPSAVSCRTRSPSALRADWRTASPSCAVCCSSRSNSSSPYFRSLRFRVGGRPSLPEREVERGDQRAGFVVGARVGANGNIEPPGIGDLVEIDLREDRVFLDAKAVVAAAIEALRTKPAEITHARQYDVHQAVQKVIHARLAQRDLAADGLAVAQLVGRDRLARLGDHVLLARGARQCVGGRT